MYPIPPGKWRRFTVLASIVVIPILGFLLLLSLSLSSVKASSAEGSVINVTTTADNQTANDNLCSLREAINNANTNDDTTLGDCEAGTGLDTIVIPAGSFTLTLTGSGDDTNSTGDLDILDSVTFLGSINDKTNINGNSADRVFDIDPNYLGLIVTMENLNITNGLETNGGGLRQSNGQTTLINSQIYGNHADERGGGLFADRGSVKILSSSIYDNFANSANMGPAGGGGLYTQFAEVRLYDSLVFSNTARRKGAGLFSNNATLTLDNSQVTNNTLLSNNSQGGGIYGYYGNIYLFDNSLVSHNTSEYGAGIFNNSAMVMIQGSTVSNNSASKNGGGVSVRPDSLIIINSQFENNIAGNQGGAIYGYEGATIESSSFQYNQAYDGGAIFGYTGMFRISDSTFYSNTATNDGGAFTSDNASIAVYRSIFRENHAMNNGGGIHLDDDYPFYFIRDSLIVDNMAEKDGGGLYLSYECSLHMENVTITGNFAVRGGGLLIDGQCALQTFNVTFSNNTAELGGAIFTGDSSTSLSMEYSTMTNNTATIDGGGVYVENGIENNGVFNIRNSILAGNSISGTLTNPTADCFVTNRNFVTGGHNIFGSGTGCTADNIFDQTVSPSDVASTVLFPLVDNGGATLPGGLHAPTHALRSDSPAIDAGSDLLCPMDDHTGVNRPQNNGCDVGAVESEFSAAPFIPIPNIITVTTYTDDLTINGNCTLREAVQAANTDTSIDTCASGEGWDVILLPSGIHSLTLSTTNENANLDGDLDIISGNITFQGAGDGLTIIEGAASDRLIDIGVTNPTAVFLQDLTLTGGNTTQSYGGCVYAADGLVVFNNVTLSNCRSDLYGGAVSTYIGALAFINTTLENNWVTGPLGNGGAIYSEDGPIVMYDSLVISNTASRHGGGIFVEHAHLLIDHTDILSNTAKLASNSHGGGYHGFEGGLVMRNNSLVQGNSVAGSTSSGGGIHTYSGAIIEDSIIRDNFGPIHGGGLSAEGGAWIWNTVIENNQSRNSGGGLAFTHGGTIENSLIQNNHSLNKGFGGGLYTEAGAIIKATNIYSNTAPQGGGVATGSGTFYILNSDIKWNNASITTMVQYEGGGGIQIQSGGLRLVQSNVSHNSSDNNGGGIIGNRGSFDIIESTISHNIATNNGGGIHLSNNANFFNSTISGNSAQNGGGIYQYDTVSNLYYSTIAANNSTNDGGGIYNENGSFAFVASIVAGNRANGSIIDSSADCLETTPNTFVGFSLFGIITGCSATAPNDQTIDPTTIFSIVIGPLTNNGGPPISSGKPADTHPLLPSSPAMDQIPIGQFECGNVIKNDQREVIRPQSIGCDIGAYESEYQSLLITHNGTGTGTTSGLGINCPSDCIEDYLFGTFITLTANADGGSIFLGWSGDCTGTADCLLTMDGNMNVLATFDEDESDSYEIFMPAVFNPDISNGQPSAK